MSQRLNLVTLLARASTPAQVERVGDPGGGRVMRFLAEPRHEEYGDVAVFEDLHGNRWDLIQPR